MDSQPPIDTSVLAQAIGELKEEIACMRAELSEVKRVSCLTHITLKSYYATAQTPDQEQGTRQIRETCEPMQFQGNNRHDPPLVPEGTRVTCVRCSKEWTPRARRPRLCPRCKTPWWFPARWKWRRTMNDLHESTGDRQGGHESTSVSQL